MKEVNLYGPGEFRIDEVERPQPGDNDVVVKVAACGICGTDLMMWKEGSRRKNGPMPLGHEAAGVVTDIGKNVRGIEPGARVAINPMGEMTNLMGNGGTEGAFADFLLVRDAELGRNLVPVPGGLPLEIAALAEPLGVALHTVNRSRPVPGEKAVVFGVGPIGLGAVLWLKKKGVDNIVAVDMSPERLAMSQDFGATTVVQADRDNLKEVLTEVHGQEKVLGQNCVGTDIFIDVAGAPTVVPQVISLAKWHARLVVSATYTQPVPVHFGIMLTKELSITTSMGYPDEFSEVVSLLAEDPGAFDPYISHRFSFDRFEEAMQTADKRSASKVMVRLSGD